MRNPFKRQRKASYVQERERLLTALESHTPGSDGYHKVMTEIDRLDKILNRTNETVKTVIPAVATGTSILGIYALQQFAGVIVPKALESLAARKEQKNNNEQD